MDNDELREWVQVGLLTKPQADAIAGYEEARREAWAHRGTGACRHEPSSPAPAAAPGAVGAPTRRTPAAAEALGYLGGVLALVGFVLLMSRVWDDLSTLTRLVLTGAAAAATFAGGQAVRVQHDPALARLRGFVWLLSTFAVGGFAAVAAVNAAGADDGKTIALVISGSVMLYSGLLWMGRSLPVQQLTFFGATAVCAGMIAGQFARDGVIGLVVWAVGTVILAVGLQRSTPQPLVALMSGSLAVLIGAAVASADWRSLGLILVVVSALTLEAIVVIDELVPPKGERIVIGVIASVALIQGLPVTLIHFANRAGIVTGLVTWAVGAVMLAGARHSLVRLGLAVTVVGGSAMVGGAALTGMQSVGFATVFGLISAVALIAVAMIPNRALASVFGALGLLINVPWAINRFFPGEGRAPLLILVSGAVIVAVAVLLTRVGGRIRKEMAAHH